MRSPAPRCSRKILLVCDPRNMLAFHWAYALRQCADQVAVLALDSDCGASQSVDPEIYKEADIGFHWSSMRSAGLRSNIKALAGGGPDLAEREETFVRDRRLGDRVFLEETRLNWAENCRQLAFENRYQRTLTEFLAERVPG